MKKILPILVIGLLILSGSGAFMIGASTTESENVSEILSFSSSVALVEGEEYVSIEVEGATEYTDDPGMPELPVVRKTFTLPRGAKILEVSCQVGEIHTQQIEGFIAPAVEAIPLSLMDQYETLPRMPDEAVYESGELYPASWYDYAIRCGLNDEMQQTTYVTVSVSPVRYAPLTGTLEVIENAEVNVEYVTEPVQTSADEYDMVIITSEEFASLCDDFVAHKNSVGVRTYVRTVDEIYPEYDGRDDPEDIKLFIKDMVETQGIKYVLLLGGLKSFIFAKDKDSVNVGSTAWHVPVRYTHIQQGDETGCLSDLYYGDLYKYDEGASEWVFEDWDPNGDGLFADWTNQVGHKEELDLTPDVYYGRLAVRSKAQVKEVLGKIITYESTSASEKDWYGHFMAVAGRTFSVYDGELDGEYVCNYTIDLMGGIVTSTTKCYSSNNVTGGPMPVPADIQAGLNEGGGFVLFEGHGNPGSWNTNYREGGEGNWVGGWDIYLAPLLSNKEEQPLVVIGGCHNGLFNVSLVPMLIEALKGNHGRYWTYTPLPMCMSWWFVAKKNGGAIASTGCTGYGLGGGEPISRNSEMEVNLFEKYAVDGLENLGEAFGAGITKFILENDVRREEAHAITVFELFADPSLKLGGY